MRDVLGPHDRTGEPLVLDIDRRDVVLAACVVGRANESAHHIVRPAAVRMHRPSNLVEGHEIGEAVAAEKQRGIGRKRDVGDMHEVAIRQMMDRRAHVAEHLVAARVTHGLELGKLACVLAFTNR